MKDEIASRSTETHTVRIAFTKTDDSHRVYIVREAGIGGRVKVIGPQGNELPPSQVFGNSAASTVFAIEDAMTAGAALGVVQNVIPDAWLHSAPRKVVA